VAARALAPLIEPGAWRTATSLQTPVLGAFPAPFDLPFVVEDWLDRARPGRLVLVEAELWPGWLVGARARGIPVVVVNARLSQGTARWRAIPPLWRWLTAGVTFIGQDQTGDLKLAAELRAATFQLGRDAFIAASTRAGDEARVILAWRGVPVSRDDVMGLERDEAAAIYKAQYWTAIRAEEWPAGLDLALFDNAVNSGPRQAVRDLQRALGLVADGIIGPITSAAINARPASDIVAALCATRRARLAGLPQFSRFGRGWTRRIQRVERQARSLANQYGVAVLWKAATGAT
jgi:hypothetical protein